MSYALDLSDVFQMAERMEQNGGRFYRQAAEKLPSGDARTLLLELASMESLHEKVFAKMREQLGRTPEEWKAYDPNDEAASYLQAFVDGRVFDVQADPTRALAGAVSQQQIFEKALGLEKDSIVFYLGIQEMIPEDRGRSSIDEIIREEMRHVRVLTQDMQRLGSAG